MFLSNHMNQYDLVKAVVNRDAKSIPLYFSKFRKVDLEKNEYMIVAKIIGNEVWYSVTCDFNDNYNLSYYNNYTFTNSEKFDYADTYAIAQFKTSTIEIIEIFYTFLLQYCRIIWTIEDTEYELAKPSKRFFCFVGDNINEFLEILPNTFSLIAHDNRQYLFMFVADIERLTNNKLNYMRAKFK